MNLLEAFKELDLLYESKQDIENFVNKFGQDTYDLFKKSTQRLKNNNISTDLVWHTKHTEKKDLENILYNLQNRTITKDGSVNSEMAGKYNYIGEKDGYKVYEVLDHIASINLGTGTGWCISGRYGHYGEPNYKPSEQDAKNHWDEYVNAGIQFYFFIGKKDKYAIAIYPHILTIEDCIPEHNKFITECNFELFNAEDIKQYEAIYRLPIELIKDKIILNDIEGVDGVFIHNNTLLQVKDDLDSITIPTEVTKISSYSFSSCNNLKQVYIPKSVIEIENVAFWECPNLTEIIYEGSLKDWKLVKKDGIIFLGKQEPKIIFKGGDSLSASSTDTEISKQCDICGFPRIHIDTGKNLCTCYLCTDKYNILAKTKDASFSYRVVSKDDSKIDIEGFAYSMEQATTKMQKYKDEYKTKNLKEIDLLDETTGEVLDTL